MENKNIHRATSRVLDVLELIVENRQGYTLTEICEKIGAPKSSMFPIVHTLAGRGYLSLNETSLKYAIGSMAFQVGNSYLDHFDIMEEVQKELQNIVNVCAETCYFGIRNGGEVLYLKKVDSPQAIRMIAAVGAKLPAYGTGIGKALLADFTLQQLRRLYPDGLKPLTEHTLTNMDILDSQLQAVRKEGFAFEVEESNQHIRCIAVPVRKNSQVVAAVSVAVPIFRYTEEKAELIKHLLQNAKTKLEERIVRMDVMFPGVNG